MNPNDPDSPNTQATPPAGQPTEPTPGGAPSPTNMGTPEGGNKKSMTTLMIVVVLAVVVGVVAYLVV